MKWRCGLIQRWLPGYPAGDLRPFWLRRVEAHLKVCPHCRQELEELREMEALMARHPLPEPSPEFWQEFNRELHLKLAQANQAAPSPAPARRWFRVPYYLLGAPALAVLVLWAAGYLGQLTPGGRVPQLAESPRQADKLKAQPSKMAAREEKAAPAEAEAKVGLAALGRPAPPHMNNHVSPEEVIYAGIEDGVWEEEEVPNWDVNSVLVDLSPQERQRLAEKLTKEK